MITVADILSLPAFESVELLAPCRAAGERRVYNVGILDCPASIRHYDNYFPDEFIVTNLGFCLDDADAANEALLSIMERRVAAVAVKLVYAPEFSKEEVARASERTGVPCFIYKGAYHEEVAYQALNLLHRDEEAQDKSAAIDALIAGPSKKSIRQEMSSLAGLSGTTVRCVAVSASQDDRCSLYAIQDTLNDYLAEFRERFENVQDAVACRYHDSLLVLVSYTTGLRRGVPLHELEWAIDSIGANCLGIGDLVPLGEADVSIKQATMLLAEAQRRSVHRLEWTDLGLDAFSFAAKSSPLFERTALGFRKPLEDYDALHGSELTATARAFAGAYGDVSVAADRLYQHPNTVRYRLRRIRQLLGMEDASDRELLAFLIVAFLD